MIESAGSLREARRRETFRRIKDLAREFTAERGLSGFTVEELCEAVGISRRTFFNYFATKELAVIGVPVDDVSHEFDERFVAEGPAGIDSVLPALIGLQLARWERFDLGPEDVAAMIAVIAREPRILTHLHDLAETGARGDIDLVVRRERLAAGDLRAEAAVHLVGTLLRLSVDEVLTTGTTDDFATALGRRLDAVRGLFEASAVPMASALTRPDTRPERTR